MNQNKTGFISRTGTSSTVYPIKEMLGSEPYIQWKAIGIEAIRSGLYQAYVSFLINPTDIPDGIGFEQKRGSGAMIVKKMQHPDNLQQLIFLQGGLTEILIENGYVINLTEEKKHENGDTSLVVYLKPSFRLPQIGEKTDQLFGNIHMEIRCDDQGLHFFKLIAHRYNDFRFDPGRSFAELMEMLFKS